MHIISNNKNRNLKLHLYFHLEKNGKKLLTNIYQFTVMEFLHDPISLIFSQSSDIGLLSVQSGRHYLR